VAMQINNPNNYKISIVNSDLDLYLNETNLGKAEIDNKVVLPPNSNEIQHAFISTSLKNVASNSLPILLTLMNKKSFPIHVKGNIKAKAKGLSKSFPVDFKENANL